VMGQHDNNKKVLRLQTEDPITQGSRKEAEGAQEIVLLEKNGCHRKYLGL
jgi:hypothetical protein